MSEHEGYYDYNPVKDNFRDDAIAVFANQLFINNEQRGEWFCYKDSRFKITAEMSEDDSKTYVTFEEQHKPVEGEVDKTTGEILDYYMEHPEKAVLWLKDKDVHCRFEYSLDVYKDEEFCPSIDRDNVERAIFIRHEVLEGDFQLINAYSRDIFIFDFEDPTGPAECLSFLMKRVFDYYKEEEE